MSLPTIQEKLHRFIWGKSLSEYPPVKRQLIYVARLLYVLGRDVSEGQLNLRAMSLVYTTLLSIVPLLAVSFSVLKAFGVHNQIEPLLLNFLEPLGQQGHDIATQTIGFIDNMKVGVLGALGVGMLFYTVISLVQKIEVSFNHVWHIRKTRTFAQRFSDYLSVILIGPVLVFSALGLSATVMNHSFVQSMLSIEPLGTLYLWGMQLLPYLMLGLGFAFLYMFIPNTRVRFINALIGGIVTAIMWQAVGKLFATFVAGAGSYTAIYSSFAAILLFMIWLYVAWLILLLGGSIAFYTQHPDHISATRRTIEMSNQAKELLALSLLLHVTRAHYGKEDMWTVESLSQKLNVPSDIVRATLDQMEAVGLVAFTNKTPAGVLLNKAAETTPLANVLTAIRLTTGQEKPLQAPTFGETEARHLLKDVDKTVAAKLKGKTLKDFAL